MVSVTDQSGEARYPSMKGILAAKKKPVETWTLADLGVDAGVGRAGRGLDARSIRRPRARRRRPGKVVPDEDGAGSAALVEFLAAGKYI